MPLYSYKAANGSKVVSGTLEAADEKEVVAKIQAMGHIPIRVQKGRGATKRFNIDLSMDISGLFERITSKDLMIFTQDLHVLLEAGLPVDRAFAILIQVAEKQKLRDMMAAILKSVEGGDSLSGALARYPKLFPPLYVNMVRAGETGGVLPSVLERLGQFMESSQDLKDYIKSAMVYPMFLVLVGGASIIIMLTFVIPKFSVIFADMGQAIPASTQVLISLGQSLRDFWWLIPAVVAAVIFGVRKYIKTPAGKRRVDAFALKMPMVNQLVKYVEVARFSRTMGTLIHSGVPILQAMTLVRQIIANSLVAESIDAVRSRVKEGDTLSAPLSQLTVFPPLAVQMISVGEETGKLDVMLLKVADNYEKSVRNIIKRMVNFLEPAMILIMGLVVGFIVISMLMAVFSMNEMPF
jgi:general secretion pathway protein F